MSEILSIAIAGTALDPGVASRPTPTLCYSSWMSAKIGWRLLLWLRRHSLRTDVIAAAGAGNLKKKAGFQDRVDSSQFGSLRGGISNRYDLNLDGLTATGASSSDK